MNETATTIGENSHPVARPAEKVSPDELLGGFSHGHLFRWLLAAVAIHAVVIGGFSLGTIRDWIDPEGAKARQEARAAAAQAVAASAEAPAAQDETPTVEPTREVGQPIESQTAAVKTPIEQATTVAAKPEEIPDVPDDIGLSIDDTNPE